MMLFPPAIAEVAKVAQESVRFMDVYSPMNCLLGIARGGYYCIFCLSMMWYNYLSTCGKEIVYFLLSVTMNNDGGVILC